MVGGRFLQFSLLEKQVGCLGPLLLALILEVIILTAPKELPTFHLLAVSAKLAWAWLFIRFFTVWVKNKNLSRSLTLVIFLLVALDIIGLFAPSSEFLDGFSIHLPDARIPLLNLVKGGILAIILLPISNFGLTYLEKNLPTGARLSPCQQVLVLKTSRLVVILLVGILVLDAIGLDFYLISIFSGALGLGLGFALPRVVANLFFGFVLLLDKSIRPDDVLETENIFGRKDNAITFPFPQRDVHLHQA